jgi:hypothetical protein
VSRTATATAHVDVITPEADPASGGRESRANSRASLIALVVAVLVGAMVYGRVAGLVYPEYSDFALEFGNHAWYHALSFGEILEKYFSLGHGWYRPTGFYLLPYLFRIDYFQPAEQVSLDIATMIVAAGMITLFFGRLRVLPAVVGVLAVLLAPSLYEVAYGVQADSFYIIFGLAFLLVAIWLFRSDDRRLRWPLRAALGGLFLLTITTKEVGTGVAFLLVPILIIREPALSWQRVKRAVVFASPFMVAAVAFAVIYRTQVSAETGTYSTHPSFDRMLNFVNLISWTFGFRSPRHTFTQWIPAWSGGEKTLAIVMLAVLAGGLLLTWRRIGLWRIVIYLITALAIALAIAAVGGIPYHGYPLVVMYGVAFVVVLQALLARIEERTGARGVLIASLGIVVLIGAQIVQGYRTFGDALYRGPHTAYLEASTELFDGATLAPVQESADPLLIFQDCLGGLHNPLGYYARTNRGTAISVSQFNLAEQRPAMELARKQKRDVFVAVCTGKPGPWYLLYQWTGRVPRLVEVSP